MERHKEAVTNANVSRLGALNTSAGALGALSGFMTGHHHASMGGRGGMGPVTEQSLHEELQQRIGHPQDLQNLQRAAVAAAASIMSPMGPGAAASVGGGHDTSHLLHHLPSGLQGQLAVAQKDMQMHQQGMQGVVGGQQHPHGLHHPGSGVPGFPDAYQQHHNMLAAASPYASQMPSFLGSAAAIADRHMPRFPPTPKMMDFQPQLAPPPPLQPPPQPPMAHQQQQQHPMAGLEHPAPPASVPPQHVAPPPPQFQSPPPMLQQQQQQVPPPQMRQFGQSPPPPQQQQGNDQQQQQQALDKEQQRVSKDTAPWEQGPVTPVPMDDGAGGDESASGGGPGGVSITGDESGAPLWTPHSSAKRLKPDPDERVGYGGQQPHQQQQQHHHQQQPFETEYLRRSAATEAYHHHHQQQQSLVGQQQQQPESSMEHVVDKLAKFWQQNSAGGAASAGAPMGGGKPGRDIRIEALLSGFPQNAASMEREEQEAADRMRHLSQSSNRSHGPGDYAMEGGQRASPQDDQQRNDGALPYQQTGFNDSTATNTAGDQEGREGGPPPPTSNTPPGYPISAYNSNNTNNGNSGGPDAAYPSNGGSFYEGNKERSSGFESARDLSMMAESSAASTTAAAGEQQQRSDVSFPVHFSASQPQQ